MSLLTALLLTTLYVRPIIATDSEWPADKLVTEMCYAVRVYADLGINLIFLEPVKKPVCNDIRSFQDWQYVVESSDAHAVQYHEIPVWFVDHIVLPGALYEGISVGREHAGIAIAERSSTDTLAHELGHQFGLEHVWDDLPACDIADCDTPVCRCNLMGVCHEECEGTLVFTDDQLAQIEQTLQADLSYLVE